MKKQTKTIRIFKIRAPGELFPLYMFLQEELNKILNNSVYREKIINLELTGKNNDRQLLQKELNYPHKKWEKVNNASWYALMIYENIVHLKTSLDDRIKIAKILEKHSWNSTDEVRKELTTNNLYPTNALLKNLCNSKTIPTLPTQKTFVMDFSVHGKGQNLTQVKKNKYEIEYSLEKGQRKLLSYEIKVPLSVKKDEDNMFRANITKPAFVFNKDGFIGVCRYEVNKRKPKGNNILALDLGKVKAYSAVIMTPNGKINEEFIPSREIKRIENKIKKQFSSIEQARFKNEKAKDNNNYKETCKQLNRKNTLEETREKISRNKIEMAKLVGREIVDLAKEKNCDTIGLENLSWNSQGGKWNFSEIQDWIEEFAEIEGITVIYVNPAYTSQQHPITGELFDAERNRNKIFKYIDVETGEIYEEFIDRDFMAAINIAIRTLRVHSKTKKVQTLKPKFKTNNQHRVVINHRKKTNNSENKKIRESYLGSYKHFNGGAKMVAFSTSSQGTNKKNPVIWVKEITNMSDSGYSLLCKKKSLLILQSNMRN